MSHKWVPAASETSRSPSGSPPEGDKIDANAEAHSWSAVDSGLSWPWSAWSDHDGDQPLQSYTGLGYSQRDAISHSR